MRRRFAALLLLTLLLSGCWSRREVNDLGAVVGLGVDQTEDGRLTISMSIAQPGAASGAKAQQGPSRRSRIVMQRHGVTLSEAIRRAELASPRRITLDHSQIIVLGERFARSGVDSLLDFLLRSNQVRLSTRILMAQGAEPKDLLAAEPLMRTTQGEALRELESSRVGLMVKLKEFFIARSSGYQSPIIAMVHLRPHTTHEVGSPEYEAELSGAVVFKGDRAAVTLDQREGRAAMWLRESARDAVITATCPGYTDPKRNVSIRVYSTSLKIKPSWNGSQLSFQVNLGGDVAVTELQCPLHLSDPAVLAAVRTALEDDLEARVLEVIHKLQDNQVEPFSFGDTVRAKMPAVWRQVGDGRWGETWSKARVNVTASLKIIRLNMTTDTPTDEEAQEKE